MPLALVVARSKSKRQLRTRGSFDLDIVLARKKQTKRIMHRSVECCTL